MSNVIVVKYTYILYIHIEMQFWRIEITEDMEPISTASYKNVYTFCADTLLASKFSIQND